MTKLYRLIMIAALGLAVAGCKDNRKATGGTADGEILPGSASDAMLPLDSARSQAPLAVQSGKPEVGATFGSTPGEAMAAASDEPVPIEPAPEVDPVAAEPGG